MNRELAPSGLVPYVTEMPRAPGRSDLLSTEGVWLLTSVERSSLGPIRVIFGRRIVVFGAIKALRAEFFPSLVYTPGMFVEVEPADARVYGRQLTPEITRRFLFGE